LAVIREFDVERFLGADFRALVSRGLDFGASALLGSDCAWRFLAAASKAKDS
jgi:hypothetical protein